MKKLFVLLLLTTLSISSYSQLNYKNCEINFNMFAPMCSTKPGGLFAVETGVSIQQPISKFINSGVGASYIIFVEPNDDYIENGGLVWDYNPSFYIPVDFNTKPIKNFSFSATGGPIFDANFDINLMFKFGVKYIVDSGELKPNWNYRVYLYINDVMTNFSIHGMDNDNLLQFGIGLSI